MALGALASGLLQGGANLISGMLQGHSERKAARDLNRQNNRVNQVNHAQIDAANAANVKWRNAAIGAAQAADAKSKTAVANRLQTALDVNSKTQGLARQAAADQMRAANAADLDIRRRANIADQKEQRAQAENPVNWSKLVSDAEAAGFNPVTYLNSGALGLYARQPGRGVDIELSGRGVDIALADQRPQILANNPSADMHMQSLAYVGNGRGVDIALSNLENPASNIWQRNGPVASSASSGPGLAVGNAMSAGVNTYLAAQQQIDQNEFQKSLVSAQLAAYNKTGRGSNQGSMGVPSYRSTGATASNGVQTATRTLPDGRVVPSTTVNIPAGGLTQTGLTPQQMEDIEKAFGGTVADVLIPVIYGPDTLENPQNQQILKDLATKWTRVASKGAGWTWSNVIYPNIAPALGDRAALIKLGIEQLRSRPITPDTSRIEYRQRNPNW